MLATTRVVRELCLFLFENVTTIFTEADSEKLIRKILFTMTQGGDLGISFAFIINFRSITWTGKIWEKGRGGEKS